MRRHSSIAALLLLVAAASYAAPQDQPQPQPPQPPQSQQSVPPPTPPPSDPNAPPTTPQATTAAPQSATAPPSQTPAAPTPPEAPSVLSRAAGGAYERRESLPSVNIYLPEGQASVRLRKLIKNVLFESQIDYRFVNGDVSTFLRYKYYAHNFTYRIGVFDQIGFPDLGRTSTQEFQRVRGGLVLFEFPRDYNRRYYWLVQDDRLTFGNVLTVDNRKNNVYTKLAYQYGTQFDERMNAIAGESRGHITPVLTAFRDLGPQKFSYAAAVTESLHIGPGAYKYTKLETEALKRSDVSATSFLVTRVHAGTFAGQQTVRGLDAPAIERYSVPLYEMFRLGDRQALRSISDKPESEGTHELHMTNEYFVPVFRNRDLRTWLLHWNNLYAIGYTGVGAVGFQVRDVTLTKNEVVDGGLGAETSLTFRDYDVILSVIYAHTLHAPDDLKGGKIRFMIRTMR